MGKKVSVGNMANMTCTKSPPEVFLLKCVLTICNKFTGEHP